MKKHLAITAILIIAVAAMTTPYSVQRASAAQSRIILFPGRGTWYVCQGYNTSISHFGQDKYALDLSTSPQSFSGTTGCSSTTNNAATGQSIYAPADGKLFYHRAPDILRLQLTSGGCMKIAHLKSALTIPTTGVAVKQGAFIGTIAGPNALNQNYAHLHISVYSSAICQKDYPVAFEEAYNFRIYGANNFPATTLTKAYRGTVITYRAITTPTPTRTKTATPTRTQTATATKTRTATPSPTSTATFTTTPTFTPSLTSTSTLEPTTETITYTPTITETATATPSAVIEPSTPTFTPTEAEPSTATPSATMEPPTSTSINVALPITATPTFTFTPSPTITPFKTLFYLKPTLNPAYTGDLCKTGWYMVKGFQQPGSQQSDSSYLTLNTNQAASAGYTATYSLRVDKTGYYRISNWVANHIAVDWRCPTKKIYWDSSKTPFRVNYANGQSVVYVNQSQISDNWATVGQYYFVAGTTYQIIIFDLNTEADLSATISAGTVRVEYIP